MSLTKQKIFWLIIFLLSSCATFQPAQPNIHIGERESLAFTGKGAAAGVMMDAYLGGAGVAIGIAIDEGIAKDIEKNITQRSGGFDMLRLVESVLHSGKYQELGASDVYIDTYGFKTFPGEGDRVTAWLKVRFKENSDEVTLTFPDDSPGPEALELSEVKTNPEAAYHLLENAMRKILTARLAKLKSETK